MQFFTLTKDYLIKIWVKILDPHGFRHINKTKMAEFLEVLARGTINDAQTLISKAYAMNIIQLLELEGCISENGLEVLIEKVESCLLEDVFDVEIFN